MLKPIIVSQCFFWFDVTGLGIHIELYKAKLTQVCRNHLYEFLAFSH